MSGDIVVVAVWVCAIVTGVAGATAITAAIMFDDLDNSAVIGLFLLGVMLVAAGAVLVLGWSQ